LEEWYKHSTQPSTIPQNPVFHSYPRCFSQIYTCSLSQLHYFLLLHTCTLLLSLCTTLFSICLHEKGKHKYNGVKERVVDGGEGSWEWLRKMLTIANVDNLLQHH
jgi:hypothetical protein